MTTDEELKELFIRMGKYPINQETGGLIIKIIMTYYATHKMDYTTLEDDMKKTLDILNKIIMNEESFDVFDILIKEVPQQMKELYSECFTAFLGIMEKRKID